MRIETTTTKKQFQSALVPVIGGPGRDPSLIVLPARTALERTNIELEDHNFVQVNSRAIETVRLNEFIRDVQVGRRTYRSTGTRR